MEKQLTRASKEALVEIVKVTQYQQLEGSSGGWKFFLETHDRKFGDHLSDPARRSVDILKDFVRTFTEEAHLKLFSKIINCHRNYVAVEKRVDSPKYDFPEQRLVNLTIKHSDYGIKYSFPSYNEEWVVTPLGKASKAMMSPSMIAVDCEMVLCKDGTQSLVRVCAVDRNLEVKLDMLVKPSGAVADYKTAITGLTAKDLDGISCTLLDAQKSLKKLLKHGTILVGHTLYNDLQALKIDHARVIDTSYIFTYVDPTLKCPSLNNLCKSILGSEIRKEGHPHDCVEDARAAMKIVLAKLEHGFDDPISVARSSVPDSDRRKLLLHNIPAYVPKSELLNFFKMKTNVDIEGEVKNSANGRAYSTYAVFKSLRKANKAFLKAQGEEYKDSGGRPQKLVSLQLSSGKTVNFYIRKMSADVLDNCHTLMKRSPEDGKCVNHSKKQRTSLCTVPSC